MGLLFNPWAIGAVVSVCNGTGLPFTSTVVTLKAE